MLRLTRFRTTFSEQQSSSAVLGLAKSIDEPGGARKPPGLELERVRAPASRHNVGRASGTIACSRARLGVVCRAGGGSVAVPHAVRSASVGDRRAARIAGTMPATAPIRIAAPMPPPHARAGITVVQCLVWA